jgi:hypothetical protein
MVGKPEIPEKVEVNMQFGIQKWYHDQYIFKNNSSMTNILKEFPE